MTLLMKWFYNFKYYLDYLFPSFNLVCNFSGLFCYLTISFTLSLELKLYYLLKYKFRVSMQYEKEKHQGASY